MKRKIRGIIGQVVVRPDGKVSTVILDGDREIYADKRLAGMTSEDLIGRAVEYNPETETFKDEPKKFETRWADDEP